jgi:hypothetical protein
MPHVNTRETQNQNGQRRQPSDPAEREREIGSCRGDLGDRTTLLDERLLACGTQTFGYTGRQVKRALIEAALDLVGGMEFFAVSHDG